MNQSLTTLVFKILDRDYQIGGTQARNKLYGLKQKLVEDPELSSYLIKFDTWRGATYEVTNLELAEQRLSRLIQEQFDKAEHKKENRSKRLKLKLEKYVFTNAKKKKTDINYLDEVIKFGLRKLSNNEREVIILFYGLKNNIAHSKADISLKLNIGLSGIEELLNKSLIKLEKMDSELYNKLEHAFNH